MTAEEMSAPKFGTLVAFILESFDKAAEKAERSDALPWHQAQQAALRDILYWLQGYVSMSLEELRETYGQEA